MEAEDFLTARERYSRCVFLSVLAEDDRTRQKMQPVLYAFSHAPRKLTEAQVRERIQKTGLEEGDVDFYLNLLCDVNFLGVRTAKGYSFAEDEGERAMLLEVARRLPPSEEEAPMFEINSAFHQALQID